MDYEALCLALDNIVEKTEFSGTISLYQHDLPIYERAAGFANRTYSVLNTLETRFGIASGTKFFTALAIARLIDSGEIKLSSKLTDIVDLPFKHYASEINIQHLLTHTSGIPDYFDEELIKDFDNFTWVLDPSADGSEFEPGLPPN